MDDTVIILDKINPGWSFDHKSRKMVFDPNFANVETEDDARTFEILRTIANSIDPDIQMTSEVPSDFPDRQLPVLGLALFIEDNQVHHSFYSKPMETPYVNLHRSALSAKTKRDSNFQEGMRRLRNMSIGIPDPEKNQILTQFMNQLRISGYDHKYRFDLLKGILDRQDQIRQEVESGTRVLYRSRREIVKQKQARLGKHNNTWFLGKGL